MRLLALLAAGLFAGSLLAADDKKPKDEDALVGTWQLDKFDNGTTEGGLTAEQIAKVKVIFKKDGKLTLINGEEKNSTFKLDTSAKPKTIDITGETNTSLGVYELDSDVLKLSMAPGGKARPAELKADTKAGSVVMTLKRVKDEKKEEKKDK